MNLVKYKSRRATHPCDMYVVTFSVGALLTDIRQKTSTAYSLSTQSHSGLDIRLFTVFPQEIHTYIYTHMKT